MKSIKQGDIILQPLNYYKSVVQEKHQYACEKLNVPSNLEQ